jgi:hypothetical protein
MTQDSEFHRALGRIEGQLATVIDMLKSGDGRHDRTENRVGAVERRQAWYSGAAAAVGAIVAYVVKH